MKKKFDKIIIGGGLYGLYSALYCGKKGQNVCVLEYDNSPFKRATYINQARVHNGYHYPRSFSTAIKSAHYFSRFNEDFGFSILTKFEQIYATSAKFSWTNADEFVKFCKAANIRCDKVDPEKYFNPGLCDGAFLTEEYTYDAQILKEYFLENLKAYSDVTILYGTRISEIIQDDDNWIVRGYLQDTEFEIQTSFILNSSYASVNQVLDKVRLTQNTKDKLLEQNFFKIKYELCEIILCDVNTRLKDTGITVMDGPFFSIMPFGKTGTHSLTSVTFTPHEACHQVFPNFECMKTSKGFCSSSALGNCNDCPVRPKSAWPYMSSLARKYMNSDLNFTYKNSLFSMKPILEVSEIDDSRPTVIKKLVSKPFFFSVLSGKINTVYDLDAILD